MGNKIKESSAINDFHIFSTPDEISSLDRQFRSKFHDNTSWTG